MGRSLTNMCIQPLVKLRCFIELHSSCTKSVGRAVRTVVVHYHREIYLLLRLALFFIPIPNFVTNFNSVLSAYFEDEYENKQMTEE